MDDDVDNVVPPATAPYETREDIISSTRTASENGKGCEAVLLLEREDDDEFVYDEERTITSHRPHRRGDCARQAYRAES